MLLSNLEEEDKNKLKSPKNDSRDEVDPRNPEKKYSETE